MCRFLLFFVLICRLSSSLQDTHTVNVTDFKIIVPQNHQLRDAAIIPDKKIHNIVQNQTDYIKKIVSQEKEKKTQIKKPTDEKIYKEISQEEYNNCRFLQILFNETQNKNKQTMHISATEAYKAIASIGTVNSMNTHKMDGPVKVPNYFFVTHQTPSTNLNVNSQTPPTVGKPTTPYNPYGSTTEQQYFLTHTPNPKTNIKYVQYEPAILQKVVMDDGRIMFYRYNNPAISYYLPGMHPQSLQTHSTNTQEPTTTTTEQVTPIPSKAVPVEIPLPIKEVTEAPTKIPNYEIDYNVPQKPTSSQMNLLKFVIPVPYTIANGIETQRTHPTYFINTYPYQRNPMERSSGPMTMPYVPVYNMIRTLTIPGLYNKK